MATSITPARQAQIEQGLAAFKQTARATLQMGMQTGPTPAWREQLATLFHYLPAARYSGLPDTTRRAISNAYHYIVREMGEPYKGKRASMATLDTYLAAIPDSLGTAANQPAPVAGPTEVYSAPEPPSGTATRRAKTVTVPAASNPTALAIADSPGSADALTTTTGTPAETSTRSNTASGASLANPTGAVLLEPLGNAAANPILSTADTLFGNLGAWVNNILSPAQSLFGSQISAVTPGDSLPLTGDATAAASSATNDTGKLSWLVFGAGLIGLYFVLRRR